VTIVKDPSNIRVNNCSTRLSGARAQANGSFFFFDS